MSEPLDRVLYDRPHYARQGFDYWQQLPDRRLLLGGFRDVSIMDELTDVEETTPTIQASLERFLGELIGGEARISHRWAGIFALTQDMLPLVGPVPGRDGVWVAAGYSGHGNVMGFGCGQLVADAMLGERARVARAVRSGAPYLTFSCGRLAAHWRMTPRKLPLAGRRSCSSSVDSRRSS